MSMRVWVVRAGLFYGWFLYRWFLLICFVAILNVFNFPIDLSSILIVEFCRLSPFWICDFSIGIIFIIVLYVIYVCACSWRPFLSVNSCGVFIFDDSHWSVLSPFFNLIRFFPLVKIFIGFSSLSVVYIGQLCRWLLFRICLVFIIDLSSFCVFFVYDIFYWLNFMGFSLSSILIG